uniref:Uncharacterized protein n=1 Tax=Schizaphis graminum TaxID=13262 RepID=A0A2S2PU92_SCHGA
MFVRSSRGSTVQKAVEKLRVENLNDERFNQENRLPGRRADIGRYRRLYGGGHGGRRLVHQELRAVQEDVGRLFRRAAVRGRVRQVQGQDDTGLREHQIRGTVSQQARMIYASHPSP